MIGKDLCSGIVPLNDFCTNGGPCYTIEVSGYYTRRSIGILTQFVFTSYTHSLLTTTSYQQYIQITSKSA